MAGIGLTILLFGLLIFVSWLVSGPEHLTCRIKVGHKRYVYPLVLHKDHGARLQAVCGI